MKRVHLLLVVALSISPLVSSTRTDLRHNTPNSIRTNLVIAPAGDNSQHLSWLRGRPDCANWDLVLLYYGSSPTFKCQNCIAVHRQQGAKWHLVHSFFQTSTWLDLAQNNSTSAIMIADDDIEMSADTIDLFFRYFTHYNMSLAQPSLCPSAYSFWDIVKQKNDGSTVRFTNFVELMAPTFTLEFLNSMVLPTLDEAYSGWGLDFIWPYLAKFPRNSIGIIDSVCIHHKHALSQDNKASLYWIEMPRSVQDEWTYHFDKFGYTRSTVESSGGEEYFQIPVVWASVGTLNAPTTQQLLRGDCIFDKHWSFIEYGTFNILVFMAAMVSCALSFMIIRPRGKKAKQLLKRDGKKVSQ